MKKTSYAVWKIGSYGGIVPVKSWWRSGDPDGTKEKDIPGYMADFPTAEKSMAFLDTCYEIERVMYWDR